MNDCFSWSPQNIVEFDNIDGNEESPGGNSDYIKSCLLL